MEAKEQGKLLQDKAALEVKLHEQVATLELVQMQRNELKQSYKVCCSFFYQGDACCSQLDLCRWLRGHCHLCSGVKVNVPVLCGGGCRTKGPLGRLQKHAFCIWKASWQRLRP